MVAGVKLVCVEAVRWSSGATHYDWTSVTCNINRATSFHNRLIRWNSLRAEKIRRRMYAADFVVITKHFELMNGRVAFSV